MKNAPPVISHMIKDTEVRTSSFNEFRSTLNCWMSLEQAFSYSSASMASLMKARSSFSVVLMIAYRSARKRSTRNDVVHGLAGICCTDPICGSTPHRSKKLSVPHGHMVCRGSASAILPGQTIPDSHQLAPKHQERSSLKNTTLDAAPCV